MQWFNGLNWDEIESLGSCRWTWDHIFFSAMPSSEQLLHWEQKSNPTSGLFVSKAQEMDWTAYFLPPSCLTFVLNFIAIVSMSHLFIQWSGSPSKSYSLNTKCGGSQLIILYFPAVSKYHLCRVYRRSILMWFQHWKIGTNKTEMLAINNETCVNT